MSTCLLTYQQSVFKCSTYKMAAKINWHRYGRKLRYCHPMYIIYKFNRFTKLVARMCQQTCKLVTNIDFPFSVDPTDPGSHTDKTSTEQIFTQNKQCSNQPTKHWHNWHDFYLTFPDFWSIPWHFQVSQTSGVVTQISTDLVEEGRHEPWTALENVEYLLLLLWWRWWMQCQQQLLQRRLTACLATA